MVIAGNGEIEKQPFREMGLDLEDVEEVEEVATQVKGRHVETGHKTLLRSSALYKVHINIVNRTTSNWAGWTARVELFPAASGNLIVAVLASLLQYILDTSVYPREAGELKELRQLTERHSWYRDTDEFYILAQTIEGKY